MAVPTDTLPTGPGEHHYLDRAKVLQELTQHQSGRKHVDHEKDNLAPLDPLDVSLPDSDEAVDLNDNDPLLSLLRLSRRQERERVEITSEWPDAINPLFLYFPEPSETSRWRYWPWHQSNVEKLFRTQLSRPSQYRGSFLLGGIFFVIFLAIQVFRALTGEVPVPSVIPPAIVFGVAAILFGLTFVEATREYIQALTSFSVLVAAAAFLAIKDLEGDFGPSTGLQVLVFATYIQSVLTFYNAVVVCWMVSIAFQIWISFAGISFRLQVAAAVSLHITNVVGTIGSYILRRSLRKTFYSSVIIHNQNLLMQQEEERQRALLHNILPEQVAARLQSEENYIVDRRHNVCILYADVVGFTVLSQSVSPQKLVKLLNDLFSRFDKITLSYGLEKIKTIGDCYMVAGGLLRERESTLTATEAVAEMAIDMLGEIRRFNRTNDVGLDMRIGFHTGTVVAGVIGVKKFCFDIWGKDVAIASRMESHGIPGAIRVSDTVYGMLKHRYNFDPLEMSNHGSESGDGQAYLLRSRKTAEEMIEWRHHAPAQTEFTHQSNTSDMRGDASESLSAMNPIVHAVNEAFERQNPVLVIDDSKVGISTCLQFRNSKKEQEFWTSNVRILRRNHVVSLINAFLIGFFLSVVRFLVIDKISDIIAVITVVMVPSFAFAAAVPFINVVRDKPKIYQSVTTIVFFAMAFVFFFAYSKFTPGDEIMLDYFGSQISLILMFAFSTGATEFIWILVVPSLFVFGYHINALFITEELSEKLIAVDVFIIPLCVVGVMGAYYLERQMRLSFHMRGQAARNRVDIKKSHERAENLLLNILPSSVVTQLRSRLETIAQSYSDATVMFCEVVGFEDLEAQMGDKLKPDKLVIMLDTIFSHFDTLCGQYHVEKIKTVGYIYMAASGLPRARRTHAIDMCRLALRIMKDRRYLNKVIAKHFGLTVGWTPSLDFRIGINSGECVAGVIGRIKTIYDLWGDTVNTASRMESSAPKGSIQTTFATYRLCRRLFLFKNRGVVDIKGKGKMNTFFLRRKKDAMRKRTHIGHRDRRNAPVSAAVLDGEGVGHSSAAEDALDESSASWTVDERYSGDLGGYDDMDGFGASSAVTSASGSTSASDTSFSMGLMAFQTVESRESTTAATSDSGGGGSGSASSSSSSFGGIAALDTSVNSS